MNPLSSTVKNPEFGDFEIKLKKYKFMNLNYIKSIQCGVRTYDKRLYNEFIVLRNHKQEEFRLEIKITEFTQLW